MDLLFAFWSLWYEFKIEQFQIIFPKFSKGKFLNRDSNVLENSIFGDKTLLKYVTCNWTGDKCKRFSYGTATRWENICNIIYFNSGQFSIAKITLTPLALSVVRILIEINWKMLQIYNERVWAIKKIWFKIGVECPVFIVMSRNSWLTVAESVSYRKLTLE